MLTHLNLQQFQIKPRNTWFTLSILIQPWKQDFKFAQDFVFKFYIDGNKIKGDVTKSGNKFLRDLAKFLSNIIYGKTVQNILKQRDFEIVYVPDNRQVTRLNYINKINSMKKISDKLIIVEKDKKTKKLDMPIYIGKAILDLH